MSKRICAIQIKWPALRYYLYSLDLSACIRKEANKDSSNRRSRGVTNAISLRGIYFVGKSLTEPNPKV